MTEYVLGIDTGGTYTDGVLLEYRSRRVVAYSKTLTTRDDLTRGIVKVLDDLSIEDPDRVRLVGISSTLATNSIAEGKTRKAGLVLIGYDPELIARYGLQSKFPTRNFAYFKGGHTSQGIEKEPPDLEGIQAWIIRHRQDFDALAVSSYFSPLNPDHEEQAFRRIQDICSLPVVLGHELSTGLDSIKRATTACVNASLVAVMQEFIEAVRTAVAHRGVNAPLMIVKGDGSLMPYQEAVYRPVETILSGPAASAIGGRFLSKKGSALVIDIGGTTTDMVIMDDFQVAISEEGARVGALETSVKAARIRTIGLGCDSRITFQSEGEVQVGPDRVVPLSRLAAEFPSIEREIGQLNTKSAPDCRATDIESWFLNKTIEPEANSNAGVLEHHQKLLKLLKAGPLSLTHILKEMDVYHAVQLNAAVLNQKGYIEHATLTPTDLLHAGGKMNKWSCPAARQALQYACPLHNKDADAFIEGVLDQMVIEIVKEAIVFLARQKTQRRLPEQIEDGWGQWFLHQAVAGTDPYLEFTAASRYPIIAIGAPASIFIKPVAQYLRAAFILPDYAEVANAVGAVAGSVIANKEALIFTQEIDNASSYVVQIDADKKRFLEIEDATEYAEGIVSRLARKSAAAAGAVKPQVALEKHTEGAMQRIQARAVGNPRLSEQGRDN